MKLRIRGSSLRLRVTRGEVERLAAGEAVVETVPFLPTPLRYQLCTADVPAITARYAEGAVTVEIPRALGTRWLGTEEVGLSAEQGQGDETLRILIEKDFACLKPREGEDDDDAFPHPLQRR
jgi:hypothetical protein